MWWLLKDVAVNMVMKVSCLSISHCKKGEKPAASKKQNKKMCKKHSFYQGTFDFLLKQRKQIADDFFLTFEETSVEDKKMQTINHPLKIAQFIPETPDESHVIVSCVPTSSGSPNSGPLCLIQ